MTEGERTSEISRTAKAWRLFDDSSRHLDQFGLLLMTILALVVTLLLVDIDDLYAAAGAGWASFGMSVFVGLTFMLALRASGTSAPWLRVAFVLVILSVLGTVSVVFFGDSGDSAAGSPPFPWVILAVISPFVVVRRLMNHRRATAQTLLGAVSAYLLIAVAFTFIFLTVDGYAAEPFFGTEEPSTAFMYFSGITMTTVGYGDLTAVTPPGRMLATLEAIIGQIYMVTIVALVVGLIVAERQAARQEEPDPTLADES